MTNKIRCKDCRTEGVTTARATPHAGPRCTSHWRVEVRRQKAAIHEKRVQATYGLPPGGYEALMAFQGGCCALCRRARGLAKRLAVDHDHVSGLVRGLLCSPCNNMLGHGRDSIEFFQRVIDYLVNPPAREVLG